MCFIRDFAMQMNIKKSIKLGLHLGYFSAKIPPKPNFDEYKIGLYARHPLGLLY